MHKINLLVVLMLITGVVYSQHQFSIDLGGTRNLHTSLNGTNLSLFHHFSEKFSAGIEINRFHPSKKSIEEQAVTLSAWDLALVSHYMVDLSKTVKWYPIVGISHTSEKETIIANKEDGFEHFWSLNTGAGIIWEHHVVSPFLECQLAWGKENQQFVILGISHEFGGHHNKHHTTE